MLGSRRDQSCTWIFPYCFDPSNAPRWKIGSHSCGTHRGVWVPSGVAGGPASMSVEGVPMGFCPGGFPLSWNPKCTIVLPAVPTAPLPSAGNGAPEIWVTSEVTNTGSVADTIRTHVGFEVKWLSPTGLPLHDWLPGIVSFSVPKKGGLPDVADESFL